MTIPSSIKASYMKTDTSVLLPFAFVLLAFVVKANQNIFSKLVYTEPNKSRNP